MGKQIVSAAPGGQKVPYEDLLGKLFVIEPLEVEKDVSTQHGVTDAVRANVFVLVAKNQTEEFEDTLIFPKVLQSQTRRQIGSLVVGRLEQGEKQKGKNAPWVLAEATAADLKKASDFWATRSISSAGAADEDDEPDDEDAF